MNGEQNKEKQKTMRAIRLSKQEKMKNETLTLLKIDIFKFISFHSPPVYLNKYGFSSTVCSAKCMMMWRAGWGR